MRHDQVAVFGATALVLALTLATGPYVGLLSVPEGGVGANAALGSGSADVTVVSAPDRADLAAGRYGDVHYLTVPDATIDARNVTGTPLLTLSIDLDGIGFSRSSVFVLDERGDVRRTVGIERVAVNETDLGPGPLEGRYRVVLRDDDGRRVVYDEPIVVEVTE